MSIISRMYQTFSKFLLYGNLGGYADNNVVKILKYVLLTEFIKSKF